MIKPIMRQLRSHLGPSLQALGYSTGIMQIAARARDIKGAIILMYHSVADQKLAPWIDPDNHVLAGDFEKQMTFLVKRRKVIALNDLITMLQENKTPENGTVIITFDDGYVDNLTVAAPILDHFGLPATLFLPTSYIDRGETQWIDQVYSAFKFRTKHKLSWRKSATIRLDVNDPKQYNVAYQNVCQSLMCATKAERYNKLNELYEQLQPSEQPPRLTMNWNDVRTLLTKHQCFEIGAHTLEHTNMTNSSEDEAYDELTGSARRIKTMIGIQPRHFSFPYGRTSEHLRQLVARAGFESAFGGGGIDPIVTSANDPYALPRIEAPVSMAHFDMLTNTANTGIWRRLGR